MKSYQNTYDLSHAVNVDRCTQWKGEMERDDRTGVGQPHKSAVPKEKLIKGAVRVTTWKGDRVQAHPHYPRRPDNYEHIFVPANFSFRYKGLDQYMAELCEMGNYSPEIMVGYIGDSTIAKLRQWLLCWETSHRPTQGAIKFMRDDARHFKSGRNLYGLTDFELEHDFEGCDIVVIKTQIDLYEAWYYFAGTDYELDAATSIILDLQYLIDMVRRRNNTTHIIVLGMNPINIRLPVPQNVENDVKAVDFATKMDVLIKDLVRSKYDCSFMSIIDSCMTAEICERPFFDTLHMGPIVNMVISRDILKANARDCMEPTEERVSGPHSVFQNSCRGACCITSVW
ncbi:MAG: hypothetical protein GY696_05770 [Gammaproteobacteria bacterium]|nr:hypothetical protein [Gammaproteobacteria bacterium]